MQLRRNAWQLSSSIRDPSTARSMDAKWTSEISHSTMLLYRAFTRQTVLFKLGIQPEALSCKDCCSNYRLKMCLPR